MSDEEKLKLFAKAVKFQLEGMIFATMKSRRDGVGTWVIEDIENKKVLNSNMEWEDEIPLSKRDEAFNIRTRFDFGTAITMFEQFKMFAE